MNRHQATFASLLLVAGITQASVEPVREGSGERRATLNAMELKPFPVSAWDSLSDWTGGEGLNTAQTDGKVVLVLTWANWNPHSKGAIRTAQRLSTKHDASDLIVVAVHDERRWNDAAKAAGGELLMTHDTNGAFRRTLLVDQDPDFYLIDRAGNLRYADIETPSVSGAVAELLRESRASAADYPDQVAREASARSAQERLSSAVQNELDLSDMPDLSFVVPEFAAYSRADWPNRWVQFETEVINIREQSRRNQDQQDDIRTFAPPEENENRFGRAPRSFDGRVTVMYFWSPTLIGSYEETQPMMDRLQREQWRDVNVIGIMTRTPPSDNRGRAIDDPRAEEQSRENFVQSVRLAKSKRNYEHTVVADIEHEINDALLGVDDFFTADNANIRYAVVAVFSSDKVMRWIGTPNSSRFRAAIDQTLRVDPGVRQRRFAEEIWIREHKN